MLYARLCYGLKERTKIKSADFVFIRFLGIAKHLAVK